MAELNLIERANKVLTFRKYIREECRKKAMEYPSDEKISEWLDQGYGYSLEDFMKDYTEKEGIFRDPFVDFKEEVLKLGFVTPPSDEEMRSYMAENGCNVQGFLRQHTINSLPPLLREILFETLKINEPKLVKLWNTFVEESAKYGEDSYIYDLRDENDINFITKNFPREIKAELTRLRNDYALHEKTLRYFQWHNLNDGKIYVKEDIKGIIIAFWEEIFGRIMLYPYAYQFNVEKYAHGDGSTYFDDVFFPVIALKVGYKIDGDKGTLTKI